jgi:hypothetical protein
MSEKLMQNFYPIPGWENYGISKNGDVSRIKAGVRGATAGLVLSQSIHKKRGYLTVRLYDKDRQKTFDVHRLMAITFLGGVPKGMNVCHNNGIKTDCRLENLRIDTQSANCADKLMHGTDNRGQKNGKNKYTNEFILLLKQKLADGQKSIDISREFGVPYSHVRNIKNGYKWKWLEV